jgi:glycosyltransferase 2 family protein
LFSKYKKKIILSVIFGALIYLIFSIYADFDKLLISFGKFNWWWLPLILSLSFGNYIFRFFKWHYYTKVINIEIPFKSSFLIFLSAFVMSVTPGKMGEVLKSYLLKEENGTSISKSAPIILAERLTDFISIVLLCISGAFVFNYGKDLVIIVGIFFISFTFLLSNKNLFLKLISLFEKLNFISQHIQKIHTAYESIYNLVKIKPLIIATVISLISWFFECLGFFLVLKIFAQTTNIDISLMTATFVYAFSTIVGAIALLPGGVGATEATLTGLMIFLKIPKDISVASTIIIRVATLWFAVFVGIIALYFYQLNANKKIEKIST